LLSKISDPITTTSAATSSRRLIERRRPACARRAGRANAAHCGQQPDPLLRCVVGRLNRNVFTPELGLQVADKRLAESHREARLREPLGAANTAANVQGSRLPENLRASLERIRARATSQSSNDESKSTAACSPGVQDATDDGASDAQGRPNKKLSGEH